MAEVAQPETSEQIAKRVVREMNVELDQIGDKSLTMQETFGRVATLTCVAIVKAIEAEREACAKVARADHGSFDAYGIGESIAVAIEARSAPPVAPVTSGVMTVDMGASETEGRVAKIEAPPGCSFVKANGTPYAVGDAVKVGDPVSYSGPLDVIKAGGSIVMNGRRS